MEIHFQMREAAETGRLGGASYWFRGILSKPPKAFILFSVVLIVYFICEALIYRIHTLPLVAAETDGLLDYIPWAQGPLFQSEPFHGPGYPAAIKIVAFFLHEPFAAAKVVSILSGAFLLLSSWLLFRSIGALAQSVCATMLLALSPVVLRCSNMIMSDMLAAALFVSGCALVIAPEQPRRVYWLVAGALCGGAYLTRYSYITALILPLLWSLLYAGKPTRSKSGGQRVLLFYAGFLCMTLPWMFWLYQHKGNPLWSENHLNFAFKLYGYEGGWNNFPTMSEFPGLGAVVSRDPLLFIRSWVRTAVVEIPRELCSLIPGTGPGIVLSGSLVFVLRTNRRRAMLIGALGAHCCALALVWVDSRYLLAILPIVCFAVVDILFAIPVRHWKSGLPLNWFGIPAGVFIVLPLLAVEALHCRPAQLASLFSAMAPEYQTAAKWISAQHRPDATILAAHPHIPFLSGTHFIDFRSVQIHRASLADFGRIVEGVRPTFVVVDELSCAAQFPRLRPLLDPSGPPTGDLRPVLQIDSPRRLVVYEFIGDRHIPPTITPTSDDIWRGILHNSK